MNFSVGINTRFFEISWELILKIYYAMGQIIMKINLLDWGKSYYECKLIKFQISLIRLHTLLCKF